MLPVNGKIEEKLIRVLLNASVGGPHTLLGDESSPYAPYPDCPPAHGELSENAPYEAARRKWSS